MTKAELEFKARFEAAFPGIKTFEQIAGHLELLSQRAVQAQKHLEALTRSYQTYLAGFKQLPDEGAMTVKGMEQTAVQLKDLKDRIALLRQALEEGFDPAPIASVTEQIVEQKKIIGEVTQESIDKLRQQKTANDELKDSLEKVAEVLKKPEFRLEGEEIFVSRKLVDKTIGRGAAEEITAGETGEQSLQGLIALQEQYIRNLENVPVLQQEAIANLEKLKQLEDELIMATATEVGQAESLEESLKHVADVLKVETPIPEGFQTAAEMLQRQTAEAERLQEVQEQVTAAVEEQINAQEALREAMRETGVGPTLTAPAVPTVDYKELQKRLVEQQAEWQKLQTSVKQYHREIEAAAKKMAQGEEVINQVVTASKKQEDAVERISQLNKEILKTKIAIKKIEDTTPEVIAKTPTIYKKTKDIMTGLIGNVKNWRDNQKQVDEENKKTGKSIDDIAKSMRRGARTIRAWGRNFLWLGRDITVFTSMAIGGAIKMTSMWAKFQEQVKLTQRVLARREGVELPAIEFKAEDFIAGAGIMGDILAASDSMAISISAATMSFGHLVRAGYDTGQALEVAEQAMILNRGSMISLADATDMMITIQKNFNKEIYDGAKIADIMTVADQNAVASMSELQSGMGFVAGSAKRMGMGLEEAAAAMVVLTNAGFSGSVAGRELRSVMNNLMQNAEDYGIQVAGVGGQMLTFGEMLNNVRNRMNYFGTELERTQFLQEVFGETNVSMVQALLENEDELKKVTAELQNSGGAAEKAADDMKQTLEYQLDQLRVAFEKVSLAIGKGFSEALTGTGGFLDKFTQAINDLLPYVEAAAKAFGVGFVKSLQFFMSLIGKVIDVAFRVAEGLHIIESAADGAVEPIRNMTERVEWLAEKFGELAGYAIIIGPVLMGLGMALELLSPVMFGLSAVFTVISGLVGPITAGVGALAAAANWLAGAMFAASLSGGGLAAVLSGVIVAAAPVALIIGIIVAAILIIIGAFQELTKQGDNLQKSLSFLEPVFLALGTVIDGVMSIILPIIGILMEIGSWIVKLVIIVFSLINAINDVIPIFELLATPLAVVGVLLQGIGQVVNIVFAAFKAIGDLLDWIIGLLLGESPGLIPALETVIGILGAPLSLAFGNFSALLNNIGPFIDGVIGGLQRLGDAAAGAIDKLAKGDLIGAGQEIVGGVVEAGQQIGGGILEGAVGVIGDLAENVGSLVTSIFGGSPGLIPGFEIATKKIYDFLIAAGLLESKNVSVAASLAMTNDELEAVVGHNFESWNEAISGKGRDVVELGADTLRALQRMLARSGEEWDWSETPNTEVGAPMTSVQSGKKKSVFGGMGPR